MYSLEILHTYQTKNVTIGTNWDLSPLSSHEILYIKQHIFPEWLFSKTEFIMYSLEILHTYQTKNVTIGTYPHSPAMKFFIKNNIGTYLSGVIVWLKDISTPDFSTPSFNPVPFNPRLFNHEFLNHGVKKSRVDISFFR